MKWILDKLEEDIDQNIYNLKKHGLGSMAFIKKLKEVKKDVKSLQELTSDKHTGEAILKLTPQCFHEDEDDDEYYLSSNGNRYYLFKKVVTLKGDREQTIYTFGKKNWLKPNDLTLLGSYNIPYDKRVVENSSGYPFLKTEVTLDEETSSWVEKQRRNVDEIELSNKLRMKCNKVPKWDL